LAHAAASHPNRHPGDDPRGGALVLLASLGDAAFIAIAVLQIKKRAPVEASPTSNESAYERTSPQLEGGP